MQPRGDGPFQVIERINDNAYKLDLPGEYNISATFNVADLSLFDAGDDSRTNPFQQGGNDENLSSPTSKDPLHVPVGPITRLRATKIKQAMQGFMQAWMDEYSSARSKTQFSMHDKLEDEPKLLQCIWINKQGEKRTEPFSRP